MKFIQVHEKLLWCSDFDFKFPGYNDSHDDDLREIEERNNEQQYINKAILFSTAVSVISSHIEELGETYGICRMDFPQTLAPSRRAIRSKRPPNGPRVVHLDQRS